VVSRLGGDEFAIVSRGLSATALEGLAERALAAVRAAGAGLEDMPAYELRCSVGSALYPADAGGVDELVATADLCMRGAKATGKDRSLSTRDFALDTAVVTTCA
jgi:diguanylate cyclase (GGDEF)-like protein